MDIFYRYLLPRGRKSRRARMLFLIVAAFGLPTLASSIGLAAGETTPVSENTKTMDADGNGHIDRIRVTFSAPMDTSEAPAISSGEGDPGIRVDGYEIDVATGEDGPGFTWSGSMSLDIFLAEGVEPDTDARPDIIYVAGGGLEDSSSGEVPEGAYATSDGAGPVLLGVRGLDKSPAALFNQSGDELRLEFSEPTKLLGLTKQDRWINLERAIRFEQISGEQANCTKDGGFVNADGNIGGNFPQPKANEPQGPDPIVSPKDATTAARVFQIRHLGTTPTFNSTYLFNAIPDGCEVRIDPGVQDSILNRAALVDTASSPNIAVSSLAHRIQPIDAKLIVGLTRDGVAGSLDGIVDAIELTFDHPLDPDTIDQPFTVSHAGQTATITSRQIGDASTQLVLDIEQIPSWTGGISPTVSYTKPASCSPFGGQGMKGVLPLNTWRTCVTTLEGATVIDGAGPVALSAKTLDGDLNGAIDGIEVTFTEAIAGSLANTAWKVNDQAITSLTIQPEPNRHKIRVAFDESVAQGTPNPVISYTRQNQASQANPAGTHDASNNQVVAFSMAAVDGVQPRIVAAEQYDADGDGAIDRVVLTYSEPVVDPSDLTGLTVGGRSVALVAPQGDDAAGDETLTLNVDGLTGTDPKQIEAAATAVEDLVGNPALDETVEASSAIDKAAPLAASVEVAPNAPIPAGQSSVVVTYTEPMDTAAVPPVATLADKTIVPIDDDEHTNGWRDDDPSVWEGTVQVEESDCGNPTGCAVTVTVDGAGDTAGNVQAAAATLQTEIDTIAPSAPTITGFTASPAAPENTINGSTTGFTVTASIVAGEAPAGLARVLLDGEAIDALDETIAADDSQAAPAIDFGSAAALQAAIAEGPHSLIVQLCDAAGNCTDSSEGLDIVADFTAIDIALTSPSGGEVVAHGDEITIGWDGDETATDLDHIELAYSLDGGSTWALIGSELLADGSRTWATPQWTHTTQAKVRATAVDAAGNRLSAPSGAFTIEVPQTFSDVPRDYWAFSSVERFAGAGVTSGCSSDRYCPTGVVTRGQMAVFLLKATGVTADDLQPYRGLFADVAESHPFARWIERLADEGITSGCGGDLFCPNDGVSRGQMSVFVLRASGVTAQDLDPYQGLFTDVPASNAFARWIERFADEGITGGCGGGRFCPGGTVTRAQMAVFLVKAFDL